MGLSAAILATANVSTTNPALRVEEPNARNRYLQDHVTRLLASFRHWTKRDLIAADVAPDERARALFHAPFAVLSHDTAPDPLLNYANRTALNLFELSWADLVTMPSRLTAQAPEQAERARLLAQVAHRGYIDDYRGIRMTRRGRRFLIERAIVWNLLDENGAPCGQAATFGQWRFLD